MVTTEPSLKVHVFAQLFPALGDVELRALADDIHEHGQRHDVIVDENGEILDGRNRAAACALIGILPRTTVFTGTDEEKMAFVMSANMQRRHMTESQRAMLAADVATITQGGNQHRKEDAHAGASSAGQAVVTQGQAATMFGVSRRSVQRARVVLTSGNADIAADVRAGRVTVSRAETLIEQRRANPPRQIRQHLKATHPRVKVADLRPNPRQLTLLPDRTADQPLIESIRKYGLDTPIIVASDLTIMSGHRRLAALLALGETETTVCQYPVESDSLEAADMWLKLHLLRQVPTPKEMAAIKRIEAELELEEAKRSTAVAPVSVDDQPA